MRIDTHCYGIAVTLDGESGSIPSELGSVLEKPLADALESPILAHARAGINVASPGYLEGIESAIEGMANAFAEAICLVISSQEVATIVAALRTMHPTDDTLLSGEGIDTLCRRLEG